jgi:hypothetical protein
MHRNATLIRLLLPLALLTLWPAGCKADPPPPMSPPNLEPCGLDDRSIPDFTLQDMNPASPTANEQVALSDFSGKVLLIFWMRAT